MQEIQAVETQLRAVWIDVMDSAFPFDDPAIRAGSLWNLGLTSANFVRLLTSVEEGFGFEWDLDESADAVSSFDNLVACVSRNATTVPTLAMDSA
ncbi:MAG: hypothetical protein M3Y42_17950 [Actinomycetota bacterium]|nr:hypothetical protein [Actinomycetota bacterium]